MAQITIYLDDEALTNLNAATENSNVSKSQWIADAIRLRLRREWPAGILALAGTWNDFPSVEEIRACEGADSEREVL
jgi:metal-responsive CopG/Arc/MetJ family transcriptional regulator